MVKVLSGGALTLRLFIWDRSYLVTSFVSEMSPWEVTESLKVLLSLMYHYPEPYWFIADIRRGV